MDNNQPTSFNPNPQPTASVDGFNQGATRPMQTVPTAPVMSAPTPQAAAPDMSAMFAPDTPSSLPPVVTMKKSSMTGSLLLFVVIAVVFLVLGGVGGYMYQNSKDKVTIDGLNKTIATQNATISASTQSSMMAKDLKSSVDALTTYGTSLATVANQLKTTCGKPCATVTIPTAPSLNNDGTLNTTPTPTTSTTTNTTAKTPTTTPTTSM